MNQAGQELMADLTGKNGADAQTDALMESVSLLVKRSFEERRIVGTGQVKSSHLDGTNFLYTES